MSRGRSRLAGNNKAPPPPPPPWAGAGEEPEEELLDEELELLEEEEELPEEDELELLEDEEDDEEDEELLDEELLGAVSGKVVTAPLTRLITRMAALPVSATNNLLPVVSKATSRGLLNHVSVPVPSLSPDTPGRPATVETWPLESILRMVEFWVSAT